MKTWIVRFASLYLFNLLLLWAIGLLLPPVSVGWAALWASVVLTLAALLVKPFIHKMFTGMTRKSAGQRTKLGEKLVQYGTVFLVELIVWVLVVWLSGVNVQGFFWGYVIPPIILLIGWAIYDAIDDRVETHAGALYDKATGGGQVAASTPPSAAQQAGARELKDGLTDEQRRMLDELGKS
jgi:hypothetical protein